jgi:beta-lactamase class A
MRVLLATVMFSTLWAQAPSADLLEQKLRRQWQALDDRLQGAVGMAVIDLQTGKTITHNGDHLFATASTIKIPVLAQVFRAVRAGEVKLDDRITLAPTESVGGSGRIQEDLKKGPVTLTVRQLAEAMMHQSDNTATNRLIALAGLERVNRLMSDNGLRHSRLRRVMMDSAAAAKGNENVTTPLEMARFLEALYRGKLGPAEDTREMVEIMKGVPGEIRRSIPAHIAVAEKTGSLPGVACEAGIVYLDGRPFIVSVYGSFLADGERPVAEAARMAYEYFSVLARSNAYGNRVR